MADKKTTLKVPIMEHLNIAEFNLSGYNSPQLCCETCQLTTKDIQLEEKSKVDRDERVRTQSA
jgi:hypothetical protein